MFNPRLKVFGIRHHGSGSARSLLMALEAWQPDALLIEAPADAEKLIQHVANEKLKPPVAALVYNPKDLQQASYFPFAEFSPEWQAMKWGLKKKAAVNFMDLPMSLNFGLKNPDSPNFTLPLFTEGGSLDTENKKIINDPMRFLAELAGYSDSERWWEQTFEQTENPIEVFDTILDMITALRSELNRAETNETLLREAHMRQIIRKTLKTNAQRIAIVCGAWHAPILAQVGIYKEKTDTDLLKKLTKTTTEATWMAWSYERLARDSGYGAGISSPAWYELLFTKREQAAIRWVTRAARLLRRKDLSASAAHTVEAVKLAEMLAILRGQDIAGLDELEEAVKTVMCNGAEAPLTLIRRKLVIGDVVGKVPPEIPQVPLQRDFEAAVKTARLTKEYSTSEAVTKELDLRKPNQLYASHLLHRLSLLSIPWGKPMKGSRYKQGSFKETWKLHWRPDYMIRLIEAAQWGNRIEQAATTYVQRQAETLDKLSSLTLLVEKTLDADLPKALPSLIRRMQELAALTEDVVVLMEALPPLVSILKYGNVRGTDATAVQFVVQQILPRIFIGLPPACLNTDDDATALIFNHIQNTHRAVNLLAQPEYTERWLNSLRLMVDIPQVHGKLRGNCTRILFDKSMLNIAQTAVKMRYALAPSNDATQSAAWLEGFLYGSGLLLIHHPNLWHVLDEWVVETDLSRLEYLLPLLRRTFSAFSKSEKSKLFALAHQTPTEKLVTLPTPQYAYDEQRAAGVLATVLRSISKV
ncbi:MAG: hypothetical protein JNL70_21965 [Saprospiraceae bacterium]|nr:hypothetical protein [Saprospiraceae bacterium]